MVEITTMSMCSRSITIMMFPATSLPTSMLGLASIPLEIRAERHGARCWFGVRLHTLEQCRIVKEFHLGEELSAPVQGKHGDNVHQVKCGLKMLSQVGRHLQRSVG